MSVQLARYLKDFGAAERRKPALLPQAPFGAGADRFAIGEGFPMPAPEPAVDVEAERAEAFSQGRAEAEAELAARHAGDVAALKQAHRAEIDALRERYEGEYATALAERFSGMVGAIADFVASQSAHVLAPVMEDVLAEKAVADMARMITEGLHDGEGLTIAVKGPAAMFEQLKSHFPEGAAVFRHEASDDVDLTVEFGQTILVTRMAAWADTVRKVLT